MDIQKLAAMVFTIGAFAAWGMALLWAMKRPRYRAYHVWVLGMVSLFWWLGESIAIRLGKYHYPNLPFRLHLPGGGTPDQASWLSSKLLTLLPHGEQPPSVGFRSCTAQSWDIPLPVVAIEAALLFGIFHLALRLLEFEKARRYRGALATAGLSGLLMVNVTAALDPVVSTTRWCHDSLDPGYHFLNVRLWEWYTTPSFPGFWFGVPLVNYAAWFLAAAVFTFVARLDDERKPAQSSKYSVIGRYVVATIVMTAVTLFLLLGVKVGVDMAFALGRTYLFDPTRLAQKHWEFGVVGFLLAVGGLVLFLGHRHRMTRFDGVSSVPIALVFGFCFVLLLNEPFLGIGIVWALTAAIAVLVLSWPDIESRIAKRRLLQRHLKG